MERKERIPGAQRILTHFAGQPIEDVSAFNADNRPRCRWLQLGRLLPAWFEEVGLGPSAGNWVDCRLTALRPRRQRANVGEWVVRCPAALQFRTPYAT